MFQEKQNSQVERSQYLWRLHETHVYDWWVTYLFLDEASGEQALNPAESIITNRTVVASPAEGSQLPQELDCCSGGGTEAQGLTGESQAHSGTEVLWGLRESSLANGPRLVPSRSLLAPLSTLSAGGCTFTRVCCVVGLQGHIYGPKRTHSSARERE